MFTPEEKLKCLRRELALRKNVYPLQVARRGRMTQEEADREIALMTEIVEEYALAAQPKPSEASHEHH